MKRKSVSVFHLENTLFDVCIHDIYSLVLLRDEMKAIRMSFKRSNCFFATDKWPHSKVSHARNTLVAHFYLHLSIESKFHYI